MEVDMGTTKKEKDGRERALDEALAQIEKHFGQGAIMRMSDNASMNVEAISTGSISLDMATGFPSGTRYREPSCPTGCSTR